MWQQYGPGGQAYFLSETNWSNSHPWSDDIDPYYGDYGNGYIPFFAVIGPLNELYYGDNGVNGISGPLDNAIANFGLGANFASNVQSGPAQLGVQFSDMSTSPSGTIDAWEWDLNGDGEIDSTEEDPYFLYSEMGTYDVSLTVYLDGESDTKIVEDFIEVTNTDNISGNISGIWTTDLAPYTITNAVEISSDDELVIESGVTVNIEADVNLNVYGKLVAEAIPGESIIFTSSSEWKGIRFVDTQEENLIQNCHISKANTSAISIEIDSNVDIIGNKIYENSSSSKGAAIDVSGSDDVLITQNFIANNTSSSLTGGIGCIDASPEITNNIIVNNTGTFGAFSLKNGSDVILENNTIANNESTNGTPYLFFIFNSFIEIKNNILIDNGTMFFAPYGDPTVTYTCITGGFTGEGNIDVDPLFMTPTAGIGTAYDGLSAEWWLQDGSPCIDAGNPDPIYNDPDGTQNDMGAYGGPNALELPVASDEQIIKPTSESSLSIYPNPFNPQTNILLDLTEQDKQQPISVRVYNVRGQLVKTIVQDAIVQTSNFVWNGKNDSDKNVSSGLYFIKVNTTSTTIAQKVMLLK